jgi:hypothetical protein
LATLVARTAGAASGLPPADLLLSFGASFIAQDSD